MTLMTALVWGAGAQVAVDFQADVSLGRAPLEVTFTDTTSTGGALITGWLWEFGDGATSASPNP
ncbi:MAG TPA: PKD domain-containing protein, partial [Candidatus Hydrogenedentes bacterium]|nr:PKD domain-containing protein [Candidatus Hydrogenedentota bacterium]